MNVLLIQPPDSPPVVQPRDLAHGHARKFVPSWNLQCLKAFVLNRTRFSCEVVDARFFTEPERQLAQQIRGVSDLKLAVIEASTVNMGPASTVIEMLRRIAPKLKIAVCGQHTSQFPGKSDAPPGADFAFCGDPEPILRNVLEYFDVENRLQRVPGLRITGQAPVPSYWLPDLKSLNMPDWSGTDWVGYSLPLPRQGAMVEMRLSRGHTRTAADRSHGNASEPLRIWPFDRAVSAMQKCASSGIVEIFIGDPPGFWTDERLAAWCAELDRARSTQPWSFQMEPRPLSPELISELAFLCCRRVEIVFPSAASDTLSLYECAPDFKKLSKTISALQGAGIEVDTRIWLGGPEEGRGEAERIVRLLRHLRFPPYSLHAFPLAFDAPVYSEIDSPGKPSIESWIKWARDPWMADKPMALWGDEKAKTYIESLMDRVEKSVSRDPHHRLVRLVDLVRSIKFVEWLEDLSVSLLRRTPDHR